jgi:spermidine/putrescine transport system substrate-binding protein
MRSFDVYRKDIAMGEGILRAGIDRRRFLKASAAGAAASMTSGFARGQAAPTLEILVANALVSGPLKGILESEAKCKINDAPFQSSTDVVARLVAPGGTSRYNLMMSHSIFSRGPVLGPAAGQEKTAALDLAKIPNFAHVASTFKGDVLERDGKVFGIPVMWGYDTVVYNKDVVPENDPLTQSWGCIFEDKYAGRIGWFDTAHQMLMAAGLYLGKKQPEAMSTAELNEVGKFLIAKKKNVRTLWTSFAQASNLLASGEIVTTFGAIPIRYGLQQKGLPIQGAWCKEGVLSFVQPAYIPKDSSHQDAAHAVINAMLGKSYASQLSTVSGYLSASRLGAQDLSAEDRKRWGYGILDGTTAHYPLRMPPNLQQWIEVWARVKSA